MAKKHASDTHVEEVTQAEVSAAIRYLDPDLRSTNDQDHAIGVAICMVLVFLAWGSLVFIWLYP
jgi:hypothetical protein